MDDAALLGPPFFLFGFGPRRKLIYRAGLLLDTVSGELIERWDVRGAADIDPAEYRVSFDSAGKGRVTVAEDQGGVWIETGGDRRLVPGTAAPVGLPRFDTHPHGGLLRALHGDILVNLTPAGPVPNFVIYQRPWYRDAALMLMVLEQTGNLGLAEEWVAGLRDPFDRNNAGHEEPDNLGQLLYMIGLVSGASHPLVATVLDAVPRFRQGSHITGMTDFREHPVYQTKWLKYGLRRLGLDDPYEVPAVADSYSALFWMDFRNQHVPDPPESPSQLRAAGTATPVGSNSPAAWTPRVPKYPYLDWARAHFHRAAPPAVPDQTVYPLRWEIAASQADYAGMDVVDPIYAQRRIGAPHTWHAAEMFLYYTDEATRAAWTAPAGSD